MRHTQPLALALAVSLVLGLVPADADAQRRRAPAVTPACTDFYSEANKDWLAANAVAGSGNVSALGELQQRAVQQQRDLLDAAMRAPQNEVQTLLGHFWASGIDEAAVEADGATPIAPMLGRINAIRRARDVAPAIAALHQVGIPVAFNFTADLDLADLDRYAGYFAQGGLGLPDPAYYTSEDPDARALLGRYTEYVSNILRLTGTPEDRVAAEMAQVIDLETRIARLSRPVESLRDPRANYAMVPVAGFARQYRNLQLADFLKAQGVSAEQVSLANPELFAQLDALVASLRPDQWKTYLRFHVGNAMAPYLSKTFRDVEFEFHGRVLRGESTQLPRGTQVLNAINRAAGAMLAREYVARHLPAATASRANDIAGNVRDALARAVEGNTWMSPQARQEATAKIAALQVEVGPSLRELDYSTQPMGRTSFGSNMLIASTWHRREEMRRIGQPGARLRWDVLPQQPVVAYDIAHNRLLVSAAALQAPVLDMGMDTAAQYGSFGALVAHELSRSIDFAGRQVDAAGNLRNWWTANDEAAWLGRADALVAQYNAYDYPGLDAVKVNGALTRDQNMIDLAAVELAWEAWSTAQPDAEASAREGFFKGWAQLWRQQASADVASRDQATAVHAPGKWRVNGPLANHPAFAESFKCAVGTGLVRKADEQISIWR